MAISMRSVFAGLIKLIETALQRLQINELNRRATSNSESIKQLTKIQQDLETLKSEVQRLHGLKEAK